MVLVPFASLLVLHIFVVKAWPMAKEQDAKGGVHVHQTTQVTPQRSCACLTACLTANRGLEDSAGAAAPPVRQQLRPLQHSHTPRMPLSGFGAIRLAGWERKLTPAIQTRGGGPPVPVVRRPTCSVRSTATRIALPGVPRLVRFTDDILEAFTVGL